MNAERLLELFEKVGEAPGAVERLRHLVLRLAVRGKLADRSQERNKSREPTSITPHETESGPWPLPSGWHFAPLHSLGTIRGGGTPPKSRPELWVGDVPWVSPKDMKTDYIMKSELTISARATEETPARLLAPRSILFVVRGMILAHSFPVAIARRSVAINQDMKAVELHDDGLAEYLLFALKGLRDQVLQQVKRSSHGTCRLEGECYRDLPIPIPPEGERQRTVRRVEELLSLCDELAASEENRERRRTQLVTSTLQRLREPVDEAAVFREHEAFHLRHMGRMTTRVADVRELREAVLAMAVRGMLTNQSLRSSGDATAEASAGSSFSLPPRWQLPRLGDILAEDTQNGLSLKPDDGPDGVPILRISATSSRSDFVVAEEEIRTLSNLSFQLRDKFSLQAGDLLACRFNGNRHYVGRLAVFEGYSGASPVYPDKLIRIRLRSDMAIPRLVAYFAASDVGRAAIEQYCATTVGNWGISAGNLKQVRLPLPPLDEQGRIVDKVDELLSLCDRLERALSTANHRRGHLLEAICSAVF